MKFKTWFYENLAGPGDGPDARPLDMVRYHTDLANKGAGAFPRIGDEPPVKTKTATKNYLDPAYRRKMRNK